MRPLFPALILLAAAAANASAQCYEFAGPGVTLKITVGPILLQLGPTVVSGGSTTTYTYSGDNELTLNGGRKTSQSTLDGQANIQFLPGTAGSSSATTFELVVPSDEPSSNPGEQSWSILLAGNGNLIPTGLLPAALPPLAEWVLTGASNVVGQNYNYIQIASGSARTKYPITGILSCTESGSGGPPPVISGIVGASAYGAFPDGAPGSWIEIYGSNLAPGTRGWTAGDFNGNTAPTSLDGVSVKIGGQAAFVDFISPTQVDVLIPSNVATGGPAPVTVSVGAVTSAPVDFLVVPRDGGLLAPASFKIGANQYVVAQFADGTYVLPTGSIAGIHSRPAKPGETVIIYGTGFGDVTPDIAAGQIAAQENQLTTSLQMLLGQTPAQVTYDGLAPNLVGVYQFNIVLPPVPAGNAVPLTFNLGGVAGKQTLVMAVGP